MGKTITVASKFSEEENERIEIFAQIHGKSKSQMVHDLVMNGMLEIPNNEGLRAVSFTFLEDFAYFWKGRTYQGTLNGNTASIKFGGEWKIYSLSELPVEVN